MNKSDEKKNQMIKTVFNCGIAKFKAINDLGVNSKDNMACISIICSEDSPFLINFDYWLTGIQLQFDDVENENYPPLHPISKDQAKSIVEFIKEIHSFNEPLSLIIHCTAGVSRSAAIGKFINDYYGLDLPNYRRLDLFNRYVYRMLFNEVYDVYRY